MSPIINMIMGLVVRLPHQKPAATTAVANTLSGNRPAGTVIH